LDDLIVGADGAEATPISRCLTINHKAPCRIACISNGTQINGTAVGSAINLSAIADASNPTGGFVINGETASSHPSRRR
jgi:hypothetical protein